MANVGRKLGANIYEFIKNAGIDISSFGQRMGYSERDIWNVIEGKVVVPPAEIQKMADMLSTTKKELLIHDTEYNIPELQYRKKFDNPDNLDFILDLMDEYIACLEAI